jgi:hypothetical protein
MSQLSKTVVAAAAVSLTLGSLTLGAAQFALGRDLAGGSDIAVAAVNRAAKTDRTVTDRTVDAVRPALPTQTISFQPGGLAATSVLVRVPLAQAARSGSFAPASWMRSGDRKAVACEPVVSVLTEVAKRLQPGRCVT